MAREVPEVGAGERAVPRRPAGRVPGHQPCAAGAAASLYGDGHPVTAVGDPRQSIYGWRGASAATSSGSRPLPRADGSPAPAGSPSASATTSAVLAAANLVADGIPLRDADPGGHPLRPGPGREGRGTVVTALHETVADEAAWVAEQVAGLGREAAVDWGKVAVLARKRSHFPRLESALRDRGVPCEVVGLGGLLHEPEVVDVVSTLRVLADPAAGAALRAAAGRRRGGGSGRATWTPSVAGPAGWPSGTVRTTKTRPSTTPSTSAAWSTRSTTRASPRRTRPEGWPAAAAAARRAAAAAAAQRDRRCPTW